MNAVKVISLTKDYVNGENYIRAVDNVSFTIEEGEFIAVIGASGSGKSTLINLISGLEKPTHGCVYVHDVNLTQLSLEEQISFRRWHIGFVFQKYNLIPAMNVYENIVLPAKLLERAIDEKEVFCLAKALGIEEKLFQMPDKLSGGQQQRTAIARAIYTHPTILLGDELTGNLDSKTSRSVMELLKEICRQYKQTLLIVTHDEKVAAMADRIICMKDGRVVENENI
nr:ABC transporter ATP-binding protein [uncultured Blautia sp.]